MMRRICVAIAFSQGAQSRLIEKLIDRPVFSEAFANFDIDRLARKKPEAIRRRYWKSLGHMRFKGKVDAMVNAAKVMRDLAMEHGSFAEYLKSFQIPQRLKSEGDVDQFWEGLLLLRADLRSRKMPFFQNTTSLLQLLLDLDHDAVKPDLIIMRLARRIGMVEKETGEANLQEVVRQVQKFAISRGMRASLVDLQILAFGGQSSASQLLSRRFCPASDPCENRDCVIGRKGLCNAFANLYV
jgi:3-methyladenine DNA glycosylase Tag